MVSEAVPAEVALLRDFVNSYEPQVDDERLDTPGKLRDWFAGHGLPVSGQLAPAELTRARQVREGIRAILLGNGGHDPDGAAIEAGNRVLAGLPVRMEFGAAGVRLVSVGHAALDRALVGLLDAIRQAREGQTWARLKVCDRETCRWAYYDTSRNQSRRWCSMAGCGNHLKMKRAYAARVARAAGATTGNHSRVLADSDPPP